jgi:hypothetical protein
MGIFLSIFIVLNTLAISLDYKDNKRSYHKIYKDADLIQYYLVKLHRYKLENKFNFLSLYLHNLKVLII